VDRGIARFLILTGLLLVGAGILVLAAPRIPWLGRLPGDLRFGKGNVRVYFPLATCLILSLLLTLIMNVLRRR
jgi:hypothetical protein